MQSREEKFFFGSLDFDSDPRYVKAGDYVDIRNFRGSISDTGNDGTLENVKSLVQVTTKKDPSGSSISLPNGVNKCIGTHTSDSTKRSFMWLWNSEGEHSIWQYDFTTNELTRLVLDLDWGTISAWATSTVYTAGSSVVSNNGKNWLCTVSHTSAAATEPRINAYYWKELKPYLNFDEFQLIYDVVELQRDGDTLLIWTDGQNEVKYINADRMLSATRTTNELPPILEDEYFNLIPYTPQLSIPIYDWEGFEITAVGSNTITVHKSLSTFIRTGDRVLFVGTLTGLTSYTEYYAIYVSGTQIQLATSRANAFTGTAITLTGAAGANSFITRAETIGSRGTSTDSSIDNRAYQFRYQWEYLDGVKSPWSPISKIPLIPQAASIPNSVFTTIFPSSSINDICNVFHLRIPRRDSYSVSYCTGINIAVREVSDGNTGDWRLIKNIDATDTSQSNDPNVTALQTLDTSRLGVANGSGGDQYSDFYEFDFTATEPRLTISQLETDELFSWLPKKVRSLCLVGDNRLFTGNITAGNTIDVGDPFISNYSQTPVFNAKIPTFQLATDPNDYINHRTYKRGGRHKYGVIYSDYAGRVSTVVPFSSEASVSWYDASSMNGNAYGAYVDMDTRLFLYPPDWADYYQIVYSKVRNYNTSGESNGKFRQFRISTVTSVGGWIYTMLLTPMDYTYTDINQTPEFTYDFTEGDKIKYLYSTSGLNWSNAYEGTITNYDSSSFELSVDVSTMNGNIPVADEWIEIYSPQVSAKEDENTQWYEIGETYRIVRDTAGDKAHAGLSDRFPSRTRDQDKNSSVSSLAIVSGGDCYTRERGMKVNSGSSTIVIGVESPWISDKFGDKSSDIGRPNIVDDEGLKEISREATGRIGQPYVPNTDINNIGFFYSADFTEYNKNYGSIQKVYTDSHSLNIFQETKFGTIPVSRSLIEDLEGQGLMAIASDLLGNIKYSEEDYGISLNGESHIAYGSYQWWADANRNAVLELSPNGFRVISDIKCKYYFDQVFQTIPQYSNNIKLIGGYDREFDEYLLTFDVRMMPSDVTGQSYSSGVYDFLINNSNEESQWVSGWELGKVNSLLSQINISGNRAILRYYDTVDGYYKEVEGIVSDISVNPAIEGIGTGLNINTANNNIPYAFFRDCIAYSPKTRGWVSRYDFECDYWSRNGNKLASIKDGEFYKHNDLVVSGGTYGDFYGTQYDAHVAIPFNENPSLKKQPLSIEIETNDRSGGWEMESATNDRGQETEIPSNRFVVKEGDLFANILRDKNSVNLIAPKTPLLDGKKIIGNYLLSKLKNTSTTFVNLFSTSLNYMMSNYR